MNQSLLKTLIKGPHAFIAAQQVSEKELYYEEKSHFLVGQAIDCYLTQGEEEFNNQYHIADNNCKPKSDTIKSMIKYAFDKFLPYLLHEGLIEKLPTKEAIPQILHCERWNELLYEACNEAEYYMNRKKPTWEEDNRSEAIKKDKMVDYVYDLFKSLGKQILTDEENTLISSIIMSFTTHPNTKDYFNPDLEDDIHIYFQLPIYFTYNNREAIVKSNLAGNRLYKIGSEKEDSSDLEEEFEVDCKMLLDILIVNYTQSIIIPVDVKTTMYEPYNFLYAFKERRYDIQGAYYTYGLLKTLVQRNWNDFYIKDFEFLVESNNPAIVGNPLVHVMGNSTMEMGFYGRPEGDMFLTIQKRLSNYCDTSVHYGEVKGIKQLFEDYKFYTNNGFTRRREINDNGKFRMEWSKIYPFTT